MQLSADSGGTAGVDLLISASRALVAVAARSLAHVEDQVTLAQYRVLVVLASRGSLRPVDLATVLDVAPSTATRMCDRLVRKDLVERTHSDSDRREVELRLSAAGRALVAEVTARRRRELKRILGRVEPQVQERLVESLQAFTDAAGELPDSAWASGLSP